jgi:hypothetical protein
MAQLKARAPTVNAVTLWQLKSLRDSEIMSPRENSSCMTVTLMGISNIVQPKDVQIVGAQG